jgi:hypothetical protein
MAQDRGGRMRGGYGGEGYSNYGRDYGRGSQGGGAEGPPFGDYGSLPSGTERRYGSEGEENYDRGYGRPDDGRNIGEGYRRGRDYAAGPGHVAFGYRPRPGDISHRGRGPRNYVRSDERVRDDVNDRLTHDRWVDATDVEVAVKRGEVTLTGSVDGRLARRRAEDIADAVLGVTHVQNNLRVHDAGGEGGGATSRRAGQAPGGSAQASPTRAPRARSVARRSAAADAAASGNPGIGGSAAGAAGTPAGGRTTSPMPRRTGRSTAGRARLIPDRDDGEGGGAPPR